MDRKDETRIVKQELAEQGIIAKVGHGRGTAWGWLEIHFDIPYPTDCHCPADDYPMCKPCRDAVDEAESKATKIVLDVTGRTGDYDGRTIIQARRVAHTPQENIKPIAPVEYTSRQTRRDIRMARAARTQTKIDKRNGYPMYY